jgi:hypothetical protein
MKRALLAVSVAVSMFIGKLLTEAIHELLGHGLAVILFGGKFFGSASL